MDLLYRDLGLVDRVLADCAEGRTTCSYQPGHPHGFHSHAYAAYVHHNQPLHDPDGALAARKARASPYPPLLRRTIVRRYLWEAGFAADVDAALSGLRPDPATLQAALERLAALTAAVTDRSHRLEPGTGQ